MREVALGYAHVESSGDLLGERCGFFSIVLAWRTSSSTEARDRRQGPHCLGGYFGLEPGGLLLRLRSVEMEGGYVPGMLSGPTHPKSEEPNVDKVVGAVTGTFKEYAWFAGTREKRRLTAQWSGSWQGSGLTGFARVLDSTKFQLRDASPVTAVGIGCCLRTWAWAGASVPLSRPAQLFCLPAQCMLVRLRGCIEEHEV